MSKILKKEMRLSNSFLPYVFMLFGFMFFLPGYPILCGVFFSALGLYKGFEYGREANDILFSLLLPIAKKDIVKGKYAFVCIIEFGTLLLMSAAVLIRMTILSGAIAYHTNPLMNANLFALGAAFFLFGLFNRIFVQGFFKTAYKTGIPFLIYIVICFILIGIFEAMHYIPGFEVVNAFGFDHIGLQIGSLLIGVFAWVCLTYLSYNKAWKMFERIDL